MKQTNIHTKVLLFGKKCIYFLFLQQQESFVFILHVTLSWKLSYPIASPPIIQSFPVFLLEDK
uniref:Uncharacterized protein n=1 Tax=Pan paniscus TaxID=9597 RepID=A0A2R9AN34_PANPA